MNSLEETVKFLKITRVLLCFFLKGGPLPFSKFEFAIAWLVREFSSYYIYFKAFTGSSIIRWRGKEYCIGPGTRVEGFHPLCSSQPTTPSLVVESLTVSTSTTSKVPVIG